MIRFACPRCETVYVVPLVRVGKKANCPRCGQRLQVPSPPRSQTVLAPLVEGPPPLRRPTPAPKPSSVPKAPVALPPPGQILVYCPGCGLPLMVPENGLGRYVGCPKCGTGFMAVAKGEFVAGPLDLGGSNEDVGAEAVQVTDYEPDNGGYQKHSGLGIASFLIAVLVGGLDVVLAVVIATGIAGPGYSAVDAPDPANNIAAVKLQLLTGGVAMYCLNCMSIPLCLVGVGLAVVGFVANRGHNHVLTWIGLFGNGVVILAVLGLHLFAATLDTSPTKRKNPGAWTFSLREPSQPGGFLLGTYVPAR